MIPYGKHHITEEDIEAVTAVLKSQPLTQGQMVPAFEKGLCEITSAPHCQVVSNGTTALHLAYLALGLQPGDRVLVPAISFAATANAVLHAGGIPEFVDVDEQTANMDLGVLKKKLSLAKPGFYKGLCVVHMAGLPMDMESVQKIAHQHGLWVVEDAAHALGASRADSKGHVYEVGSCRYSDATTFSFHPVKHVACGEGGAVTSRDPHVNAKVKLLRSHGITRETPLPQSWQYDMLELGYNFRMSDLQAALGLSQLKRLRENVLRRTHWAEQYQAQLGKSYGKPNLGGPGVGHALHLYVIQTPRRNELYKFLLERGIQAQVHYLPIYSFSYYKNHFPNVHCPQAETYSKKCLSLPLFPTLGEDDFNTVIQTLSEFEGKHL